MNERRIAPRFLLRLGWISTPTAHSPQIWVIACGGLLESRVCRAAWSFASGLRISLLVFPRA